MDNEQHAPLERALNLIASLQRRDFLKFGSAAVALSCAGGAGGAGLAQAAALNSIGPTEANVFHRVAQVTLPVKGSILAPWKADVLLQTLDAALLGTMAPHILAGLKGGVAYFNDGPKAMYGKTFVELDDAQATRFLDDWGNAPEVPHRALAAGLKKLVQLSYWANPETWPPLGYDGPITKRNGLVSLGNAPLPTK